MKTFFRLLAVAILTGGQMVSAADVPDSLRSQICDQEQTGRWETGIANRIIEGWQCSMKARVGGVAIGFGGGVQVLSGKGYYVCEARNIRGEVAACYREKIGMAFAGGGVGIGLSLIGSMDVYSLGIKLIDLDPEELIGTRFGASAEVGVHVLRNALRTGATISFSTRSGILAGVGFAHARGFGLHAGAHINGFVMSKYRASSSAHSKQVFAAENLVDTISEARQMAENQHPGLLSLGSNIRRGNRELKNNSLNEYIRVGLQGARNQCAATSLRAAYIATQCESDESCSRIYVRAVCNN